MATTTTLLHVTNDGRVYRDPAADDARSDDYVALSRVPKMRNLRISASSDHHAQHVAGRPTTRGRRLAAFARGVVGHADAFMVWGEVV